MGMINTKKEEGKSLSDEAYYKILDQLISFGLSPGDHLSIDGLSVQLGMSQTPVRSALIRLEVEGMVGRRHNSGFKVAGVLDTKALEDIYRVRLLLEPEAAVLAAKNATVADLEKLAELCEGMRDLALSESREGYGKFAILDREFHDLISKIGGNNIIRRILTSLQTQFHLLRVHHHPSITEDAIRGHEAVLNAIRMRDTVKASELMRIHISESFESIIQHFDPNRS
jgi:DNA-binding GntR family transcriptional regulator